MRLVAHHRRIAMSEIEHCWFSIAVAENSNRAAATATGDLRAEESLVGAIRSNQADKQISAVRTQTTRRVAGVGRVHQLAHCHLVSQTRANRLLVQQLSKLLYS